jgi:hypothetical protein
VRIANGWNEGNGNQKEINKMTTENTAITMYDKISNPMEAIAQMGEWISKSGLFGCEKAEQGMVLAMTAYAERRPVTDICRRYHIMDGKLSMKSEAMLAEFNQRGGVHFWKKSDNKEAILLLTSGQFQKFEVSYTIQDAERAGLCGKDGAMRQAQNKPGGWQRNPDAMLRARCVSKGVRMVDPGVVVGVYTPEEVGDMRIEQAHDAPVKSLLSAAPVARVIEAEVLPPSVDTPANSEAIEAEKVEPPKEKKTKKEPKPESITAPAKSQGEELRDFVASLGNDAMEWLVVKGWLKADQTITDLAPDKCKQILDRKGAFSQAIKTWMELKEKNNASK